MPTRPACGSRACPNIRAPMRRSADDLQDRRLREASPPRMSGAPARDDFASQSKNEDVRRARRGAHILRYLQAEMEHEGERLPEDLRKLLMPAKRVADDARADGREVPKSTRDWIAREHAWGPEEGVAALRRSSGFRTGEEREARAKEEASRARSRPAIAGQDGASASLPARPFRAVANDPAERGLRMTSFG